MCSERRFCGGGGNDTNFVYDIRMSERLLHGVPVSDEQIQAWADEAERGYDLADLPSPRLNAPYGARCFLTRMFQQFDKIDLSGVLMRLMALGAF